MRNDELKPCPFCGGEAKLHVDAPCYFVRCEACFAMSDDSAPIRKWNARADEAAIRRKALEEAV